MGYFGSIVLARLGEPLTNRAETTAIGHRYRFLRDLGGGWQVLETNGWPYDPPDLAAVTTSWASALAAPIVVGYVSNGDCAAVYGAAPGGAPFSLHLPDPAEAGCGYRHDPRPGAMRGKDAADRLAGWAVAAGLTPDVEHLDWLTQPRPEAADYFVDASDLMFELVLAVGAPAITSARRPVLNPYAAPYRFVTDEFGLGACTRIARHNNDPVPDWGDDAVALEYELWAAVFRDDADQAALLARVRAMLGRFQADQSAGDRFATARLHADDAVKWFADPSTERYESPVDRAAIHPVCRTPMWPPTYPPGRQRTEPSTGQWHRGPATYRKGLEILIGLLGIDSPHPTGTDWQNRARMLVSEAVSRGPAREELFEPLLHAAVNDPDHHLNRRLVEPAVAAFGRRRVQQALLACLQAGTDDERTGAARAWYWAQVPLIRQNGTPTPESVAEFEAYADLRREWHDTALPAFIAHDDLQLRLNILRTVDLHIDHYPDVVRDTVAHVIHIARTHPYWELRYAVVDQLGSAE